MNYIYVLIDPRDNQIRYVGKTNNIKTRLTEHCTPRNLKNNTYKVNWIRSVLNYNLRPILKVIEQCDESNWQEREIYWIKYYRDLGYDLTNATEGGEGTQLFGDKNPMYGIPSPNKGRKHSEETKRKIRESQIGKLVPIETRELQRKINTGSGNPRFDKKYNNSSLIYRGVFFKKDKNKYASHMNHKGKVVLFGYFKEEIDAAKCRDYCVRLLNIDCTLNFPEYIFTEEDIIKFEKSKKKIDEILRYVIA